MYQSIKKSLLLVGSCDSRFNVEFFLNACLVINIKRRVIVLKCIKVNKSGLYKLEAKGYLNYEVNIIFKDPNESYDPTITKTILWHNKLRHLNFETLLHDLKNKKEILRILKFPKIQPTYKMCKKEVIEIMFSKSEQMKSKSP
jgi:hypothetical protein